MVQEYQSQKCSVKKKNQRNIVIVAYLNDNNKRRYT